MALEAVGSNPIIHPIESGVRETSDPAFLISFAVRRRYIGLSPSGKAPDFDSDIRRFESCQPSQFDPVAQPAEHLPFKQGVRGSNPRWITKKKGIPARVSLFVTIRLGRTPDTPIGYFVRHQIILLDLVSLLSFSSARASFCMLWSPSRAYLFLCFSYHSYIMQLH